MWRGRWGSFPLRLRGELLDQPEAFDEIQSRMDNEA